MREASILNIQKAEKVEKREARNMLEGRGDAEEHAEGQEYERYLHIKVDRKSVRIICPFRIEKYFQPTLI